MEDREQWLMRTEMVPAILVLRQRVIQSESMRFPVRKKAMQVLLVLSLVLASCSTSKLQTQDTDRVSQGKKQMELNIPNAAWVPEFFKEINEHANAAKLNDLRLTVLPDGDLEIRVWGGFGILTVQGLIIKRTAGQWSAFHLPSVSSNSSNSYKNVPVASKSGWEQFWKQLTDEGFLTLPDSSQLRDEVSITDGISYVVEINMNKTYRTYMYGNPQHQKSPEAKQMLQIVHTLSEEFGVHL